MGFHNTWSLWLPTKRKLSLISKNLPVVLNFPVSAVRNMINAVRTSVIRKINTIGRVLAKAVAAVCIFLIFHSAKISLRL